MTTGWPKNRLRARSGIIMATMLSVIGASGAVSTGQEHATGSTSDQARKQAIASIPFAKLPDTSKRRISEVVRNSSIYRRLPRTTINCDPDLYLFLVRYPEVLVNIWQIMGVSKMSATRTGPYSLTTKDGGGTQAKIDLLYGSPNLNIYYGEGTYAGPLLLGRVAGQCLLILTTEYRRDRDGTFQATSQLDVFLKIDHLAAGIIAKTVHPLVGSTADHNYVETLRFLQKLSETSETNAAGVQRLAMRLNQTHPEVRRRFAEMVGLVYRRTNPNHAIHAAVTTGGYEPAGGGGQRVQSGYRAYTSPTGTSSPAR